MPTSHPVTNTPAIPTSLILRARPCIVLCCSTVSANTEQNSEQLTGRRRSLANLKPWPKGFCPNPNGRGPKPITEAYTKLAHKKVPGDPKGRTYAELVAEGQYTAAGKGKTEAAREIADRLEGKAAQPFRDDTPSMSVTLDIEVVRKKLFGDDE